MEKTVPEAAFKWSSTFNQYYATFVGNLKFLIEFIWEIFHNIWNCYFFSVNLIMLGE